MAITRQRIAHFVKTALLFVAEGLLDTLILVTISLKVIRKVFANPVTYNISQISNWYTPDRVSLVNYTM